MRETRRGSHDLNRKRWPTAALNHPNILVVHDIGRDAGTAYVVAELLEGRTLRAVLDDGLPSVAKAVDYAGQIAQGLAAAHGRGIVHRDIKPENLFVTPDDRVKILDFGLAKAVGQTDTAASAASTVLSPRTEPGSVLGTVGYMAPEQVRGEPADTRADLFSFGAVLHEMLTGQSRIRARHGGRVDDRDPARSAAAGLEPSRDSARARARRLALPREDSRRRGFNPPAISRSRCRRSDRRRPPIRAWRESVAPPTRPSVRGWLRDVRSLAALAVAAIAVVVALFGCDARTRDRRHRSVSDARGDWLDA